MEIIHQTRQGIIRHADGEVCPVCNPKKEVHRERMQPMSDDYIMLHAKKSYKKYSKRLGRMM